MMTEASRNVERLVRIADERFDAHRDANYRYTDRVLAYLLIAEWIFGVILSLVFSPDAWEGKTRILNIHVPLAILLGGAIVAVPVFLAFVRPGWTLTRHVIAIGQLLTSALLIHLSGGRIETHFHVFGSLAFLAFYRDWKVLITGTLVVVADHFLRGTFYPESVYGITNPEWWRFLEHAFWVVFIDIVLVISCIRGVKEMRRLAEQSAQLEAVALSHMTAGAA